MKTFALLALLLPGLVSSETADIWVNAHLLSSHSGEGHWHNSAGQPIDYNEKNLGLGLGYELTPEIEARFGGFYNSYFKTSLYAGTALHSSYHRPFSLALIVGIVSGYEGTRQARTQPVEAFILPTIIINHTRWIRSEIGYLPAMSDQPPGDVSTATWSMGVKF